MKKILLLINSAFPYGRSEPWLEDEQYYYRDFDKILVVPVEKSRWEEIRTLNPKIELVNINPPGKIKLFLAALQCLGLQDYKDEREKLQLQMHTDVKYKIKCIKFMAKSYYDYKEIIKYLNSHKYIDNYKITLYSYWMKVMAYTCVLLKKSFPESKFITRCHGVDLYEYRHDLGYIPMRTAIFCNVDKIFPISEDGKKYLVANSHVDRNKIEVSYLGAKDNGIQTYVIEERDRGKKFSILSCSNIVDVKRIDRIIASINILSKKYNGSIIWKHYGDGPLKNVMEEKAAVLLPDVSWEIIGSVSHPELMKKIHEDSSDVFINTSESEGIPVSIMEALSFGIPVIAPDVGGISEIIMNGLNGFLINEKDNICLYAEAMQLIADMNSQDYFILRRNARRSWEDKWNLSENYNKFAIQLSSV